MWLTSSFKSEVTEPTVGEGCSQSAVRNWLQLVAPHTTECSCCETVLIPGPRAAGLPAREQQV